MILLFPKLFVGYSENIMDELAFLSETVLGRGGEVLVLRGTIRLMGSVVKLPIFDDDEVHLQLAGKWKPQGNPPPALKHFAYNH